MTIFEFHILWTFCLEVFTDLESAVKASFLELVATAGQAGYNRSFGFPLYSFHVWRCGKSMRFWGQLFPETPQTPTCPIWSYCLYEKVLSFLDAAYLPSSALIRDQAYCQSILRSYEDGQLLKEEDTSVGDGVLSRQIEQCLKALKHCKHSSASAQNHRSFCWNFSYSTIKWLGSARL